MKIIDKKMCEELINILKSNHEFYGIRKYNLKFKTKYDYGKENHFGLKLDDMDTFNMEATVTIPKFFRKENFDDTSFYYRYIDYMKSEFKFDIKTYAEEIDCKVEDVFICMCMLHELGHLKNFLNDQYKKLGYLANLYSDREKYNFAKHLQDCGEDIFLYYRKEIGSEYIADKYGVKMMNKYKEQIKDILNKGYIVDECELAKAE